MEPESNNHLPPFWSDRTVRIFGVEVTVPDNGAIPRHHPRRQRQPLTTQNANIHVVPPGLQIPSLTVTDISGASRLINIFGPQISRHPEFRSSTVAGETSRHRVTPATRIRLPGALNVTGGLTGRMMGAEESRAPARVPLRFRHRPPPLRGFHGFGDTDSIRHHRRAVAAVPPRSRPYPPNIRPHHPSFDATNLRRQTATVEMVRQLLFFNYILNLSSFYSN